jgi:pyrroloquinoline quinone biosynthesis protein B
VRLRLLGTAAGGGFPQWNCACAQCAGVRAGTLRARRRTQASAAATADGTRWALVGASPDVASQIEDFEALHPRAPRRSPIAAVLLPNGDLDSCLGLFVLREEAPLAVYATAAVIDGLITAGRLVRTLMRSARQVVFRPLPLDENVPLCDVDGAPLGMRARAIPAPGKAALHLDGVVPRTPEENVGFVLRADAGAIAYFPSVAGPSPQLAAALAACRAIVFDGTFYRDDEMTARGLSARSARAMAHWPLEGDDGSLAFLAGLAPRRRILTHVNNTNPILVEDSVERRAVEALGVEVGHDGLEVLT